jgi:PilZ domain-containing protein
MKAIDEPAEAPDHDAGPVEPPMVIRKYPRFGVQLPVSFSKDELDGDGTVYNLSMGGCRVESDHTIQQGEYVALRLYVSYGDPPVMVQVAAVRWATGKEFGLEFLVIAEEQKERLSGFLARLG